MIFMDDITQMMAMEYGIPALPKNPVPAMAYIPFQNLDALFTPEQGLSVGTMFPVLDKPFVGCGGTQR